MKRKLFISYLLIVMAAVGISLAAFWTKGYSLVMEQSRKYYQMEARYLGDIFLYEAAGGVYDDFIKTYSEREKVRITLIDRKGNVIKDSQASGALENHREREEVKAALLGEEGFATRKSQTLGHIYCYSAVPVDSPYFNGVLRISVPMEEINELNQYIAQSIILLTIFCFSVALSIAFYLSRKLTKPIEDVTAAAEKIAEGNYETVIYTEEKDQIGRLAGSFNRMTANLQETIGKLMNRNIELEAMLSSIQGGVVAIDRNNTIMFYNSRFAAMAGNPEKDYTGLRFYDEIQNESISSAVAFAKNNEVDNTKEGEWNGKNIRTTATPLADENRALGMLIIIEDITRIRKLESLRSEFVSNVTHELKTPLTSIRGFVDTLKNGAIQDEKVAVRFLDIIDIEAERLTSLIQDILLLSEIESSHNHDIEACSVNHVINEVKDLLEPQFNESVRLIIDTEPYIRPYSLSPGRLKELLINLINNGYKYTEEGFVKLTCREDGDTLLIQVEDTGIGIEQEHLPRIFERFYRVDKSRSRKQGGTGLGLSIVKHIVELYNGKINVDSKVGEGTRFEIRLPY